MPQIRGVFPLPQTSPQIAGVDQVVCLVSGGVYVLPAGNFLISTGPNTALQWFDPLALTWRPWFPHQAMGYLSGDGANYRLINQTGIVLPPITIGSPGTNGTNGIGPIQTGTTISFAPSPTGQQAVGYVIIGGSVPAPNVVQGGSGYVVPPIVCCDPPPVGGVQATFTATIANGAITGVTQQNPGAGYTSVPQFYVIPQPMYYQGALRWPLDTAGAQQWPAPGLITPFNIWPGTIFQPNISPQGALLVGQPLTGSGTVTGINVIYGGGGYTGAPGITFAGGPLTGAAATAAAPTAAAIDTSYVQAKVN